MSYLTETEASALLEEAKRAIENTYSPYSNFIVGAAVKTKSGHIYRGSNIENASYGLTICAERIAIGNALSHGDKEIQAIAVWTTKDSDSPCGACRQFILEFGVDIVVIFRQENKIIQRTSYELLPFGFTKDTLI